MKLWLVSDDWKSITDPKSQPEGITYQTSQAKYLPQSASYTVQAKPNRPIYQVTSYYERMTSFFLPYRLVAKSSNQLSRSAMGSVLQVISIRMSTVAYVRSRPSWVRPVPTIELLTSPIGSLDSPGPKVGTLRRLRKCVRADFAFLQQQ